MLGHVVVQALAVEAAHRRGRDRGQSRAGHEVQQHGDVAKEQIKVQNRHAIGHKPASATARFVARIVWPAPPRGGKHHGHLTAASAVVAHFLVRRVFIADGVRP